MVSLLSLAECFNKIEVTSKRLEMTQIIANYLEKLTDEESAIFAYLLAGRLGPEFMPVEFQLATKSLVKAVSKASGNSEESITQSVGKLGDIGESWFTLNKSGNSSITLSEAYELLWEIAAITGKGVQEQKQQKIGELLLKITALEGKYILRILNGKLRLGASEKTVIEALGAGHGKETVEKLKTLMGNISDIGYVCYLYKKYGENAFTTSNVLPGVPVFAKLVEREATIEDIYTRIPMPYEEPKYDGLRLQTHIYLESETSKLFEDRIWYKMQKKYTVMAANILSDSQYKVRLFSRNLEEMTDMFPEVVEAAQKLPVQYESVTGILPKSLILDAEVIGYYDESSQYAPFKDTMTRKRKYSVDKASEAVPVKVFVFDFLECNGENLMGKQLVKRKEMLSFLDSKQTQNVFVKTPWHEPESIEEGIKIFEEYVVEGLEGVIFKNPSGIYEPGVRNFEWIKFKRAMRKDLADTVDVVILGYYYGRGDHAKLGIGALLTGVYDSENDKFVTVTKLGTKVTDELWREIKTKCDTYVLTHPHPRVEIPKPLTPDVLIEPAIVVEVEADEITPSPIHSAKYALRFPRFIRFREKKPTDTTTLSELIRLGSL